MRTEERSAAPVYGPDASPMRNGAPGSDTHRIEVSVVMPCLNEADTLAICIEKAQRALRESRIDGEVIVADNGSTDASQEIARKAGARLVAVTERGYGAALMGGIAVANGRFIIMGDADESYDFLEIPKFIEKLRQGYDLVQGCRLPWGGGRIEPGAMPLLHKWWGNPMFTMMARKWFHAPVHDVYCGLRGFTSEFYHRLDQRCTGMEFATEMIIKAGVRQARVAEVPITLHRDGRVAHAPHLKTFRDGWRTLRFFLLYSPRWLFMAPGILLAGLGLIGYALALPGTRAFGVHFDAHTLLFASLFLICGYQSILFAAFAKTFAIGEGLIPLSDVMRRLYKRITLVHGLAVGATAMIVGSALLLRAILQWRSVGYGNLDYAVTMRWVVPGVTLVALGFQTVLSSFFLSLLGMRRR